MKAKQILTVLLLVLGLSACSNRFVYNNLDWLVHWYLDDYIELNKVQKQQFDEVFAKWHQWHRAEELPRYQTQLTELRTEIASGPMQAEQFIAHMDRGWLHFVRLREHVADDIIWLAKKASDEQIAEFFQALEEKNAKREKSYLAMTTAEQRQDVLDDVEENLSGYFGRLSAEQKGYVAEYADTMHANFLAWLEYRRLWQQSALALLNQRNTSEDFATRFKQLLVSPESLQTLQYQQHRTDNRQAYAQLLAKVQQSLSAKQQKRVASELDDLIEMLANLAP